VSGKNPIISIGSRLRIALDSPEPRPQGSDGGHRLGSQDACASVACTVDGWRLHNFSSNFERCHGSMPSSGQTL
jgi:hypothetical protein